MEMFTYAMHAWLFKKKLNSSNVSQAMKRTYLMLMR